MAFAARRNCYVCDVNVFRRNWNTMVVIYGEDRRDICNIAVARRADLGRAPLEVVPETRICNACHMDIRREIDLAQGNLEQENVVGENQVNVRLNVLRHRRNNECFICHRVDNIHRLSVECKVKVLIDCNIFFPETVRSCNHHLDARGYILQPLLLGLESVNRQILIGGPYIQAILSAVSTVTQGIVGLNDIHDLNEQEMHSLTSLTKDQFEELYTYCDRVPHRGGYRYIGRKDLLMFLCKMRQGCSDDFLTALFKYNDRRAVSDAISLVRESLMLRFVPENLGLNAITRAEYIRLHVTEFANRLYNDQPQIPKAISYINGSYLYCYKSKNFRALRQSFCFHKGRHLVKPALMVAPDGYILDVHGPYFSDNANNDAAMLRHQFDNDEDLRTWFRDNDIIIVDRGYRDAVELLQDTGLEVRMPPLIEPGETQLSTEDANESRIVTKTRWVVESRNGHLKSKFKFLNLSQQTHVLPNIGDFYRIGAAIINRFHPTIRMHDYDDAAAAQRLRERALQLNHVQQRVEREQLAARDGQRWIRLDADELDDFPALSIDFLKDLTAGVYQVELAPSYVQDKLQREDNDEMQIEILNGVRGLPQPGFLRARIHSRFRNQTRYQLWIEYVPNAAEDQRPIRGYYCTCRTGARTLGTCAHIASVLWYLGYARFEPRVHYPSHRLVNEIEDATDRPPMEDPH